MDLEQVWKIREEDIYPAFFGSTSRGIFPLELALFTEQFRQSSVDPRWLHYGIFEFAPIASRGSWLYVTSGHSNPWEQEPDAYSEGGESGAGVEFTLAATEQGDWAIRTLQSMLAFDVLLCAGRYAGKGPLSPHDRIPLQAPLNGEPNCALRNLVVTEAEGIPAAFELPSGKVRIMGFTGLSDEELHMPRQTALLRSSSAFEMQAFTPSTIPTVLPSFRVPGRSNRAIAVLLSRAADCGVARIHQEEPGDPARELDLGLKRMKEVKR